jgi:type I restriction enzyme S subunit
MAGENEWKTAALKDCISLVIDHRGKTPKKLKSDWVNSGIPTISAKNVNGGRLIAKDKIRFVTEDIYQKWMNTGDVTEGDCLLVSEGATLGECMYWDNEYPIVLGQRLFCLRVNPNLLTSRFLYACMTSSFFQSQVVARATGTSVPGLRQTEVLKLRIPLPSLNVQRPIGDVIYHLNAKIELNRRMNETLEEMARALFKSWFVDFDPVRAKLDGRQPAGMDAETAALFPADFQESELGKIPKGWEVKSLGELLELSYGKSLKAADRVGGCVPVYGSNGIVGWHDASVVDGPGVIVGRKGNPGIIKWSECEFYPIDTTFYVQSKLKEESLRFLFYLLGNLSLARLSADTAVPGLNRNAAYSVKLTMPSEDSVTRFELIAQNFMESVYKNNQYSKSLASLRDTLLPKLLSGELRIKDAEKFVEAAV